MTKKYDAIVIGAGLGGLSAATMLVTTSSAVGARTFHRPCRSLNLAIVGP